jgi:hypothetical protein
MPKDEFDFEDPFELNGMAFLTHEDTTNAMAECFIEEFLRMGYNANQVLALFRNPHYVGPSLALEKCGEPFVRDLIVEVFARWGKVVAWPGEAPVALAFSPSAGEREHRSPSNRERVVAGSTSGLEISKTCSSVAQAQTIESDDSLTDPMGSPIPKLNA